MNVLKWFSLQDDNPTLLPALPSSASIRSSARSRCALTYQPTLNRRDTTAVAASLPSLASPDSIRPPHPARAHHIEHMMAQLAGQMQRRRWLSAIRLLLQSAVPTMRRDNPAVGIASPKPVKSKGHHTWTDEEIAQYRAYWPSWNSPRKPPQGACRSAACPQRPHSH
jgi:hypothetical protein